LRVCTTSKHLLEEALSIVLCALSQFATFGLNSVSTSVS
jgi:hypothetical protein